MAGFVVTYCLILNILNFSNLDYLSVLPLKPIMNYEDV